MIKYNVTNEASQSFIMPFEDTNIVVNLEYLSTVQSWIISLDYRNETLIQGMKLNSANLLLDTYNLPFDIYINDVNSLGLSPFDLNSFSDELYEFYLIEREELTSNRGYSVE